MTGPTALAAPQGVEAVPVESAQEMFEAVASRASVQDIIVKCAAVADFRPRTAAADKIKKGASEGMTLELERTRDILAYLGQTRAPGQVLCGFSMETRDLVAHSQEKLEKKHADMIVANNLNEPGAGFAVPTNAVTLLTKAGAEKLPLMGKDALADEIFDRLLAMRRERT